MTLIIIGVATGVAICLIALFFAMRRDNEIFNENLRKKEEAFFDRIDRMEKELKNMEMAVEDAKNLVHKMIDTLESLKTKKN